MTLASLLNRTVGALWRDPLTATASEHPVFPDMADAPADVRRLIRDRRYCKLLTADAEVPFDDASLACAWKAIEHDMALVPAGEASLVGSLPMATPCEFGFSTGVRGRVPVSALYIDRYAVTNADFARFVAGGGYDNADLWPPDMLSHVLQFIDRTGCAGPHYWSHGKPPADKKDHPVVGVCWYEAFAYAKWAAKRLPTTAEWQRAGSWPSSSGSSSHNGGELHYPWGNAFDPRRANTWAAGRNDTTAVAAFRNGCTPNGICQLIGNVWEWVDAQFQLDGEGDMRVIVEQPMGEIRGGAFDTYFSSQATCQFRSGKPLLYRGGNVGFRCCLSVDRLPFPPKPSAFLQDESNQ